MWKVDYLTKNISTEWPKENWFNRNGNLNHANMFCFSFFFLLLFLDEYLMVLITIHTIYNDIYSNFVFNIKVENVPFFVAFAKLRTGRVNELYWSCVNELCTITLQSWFFCCFYLATITWLQSDSKVEIWACEQNENKCKSGRLVF